MDISSVGVVTTSRNTAIASLRTLTLPKIIVAMLMQKYIATIAAQAFMGGSIQPAK
jgi:hypothetical protein